MESLKNILLILLFVFSTSLFSQDSNFGGMVTALEAPLFRVKDLKSPVIQYVRKGEIIFIHPEHFRDAPYDRNYTQYTKTLGSNKAYQKGFDDAREEFYTTLDKSAQLAYIPKKYVKLIFNDSRETSDPNKFSNTNKDETDYRLTEPLSPKYPFKEPKGYRGFVSVGSGNRNKEHYTYTNNILKSDYSNMINFHWAFMSTPEFDNTHSFFYGGMFTLKYLTSKFQLDNGFESDEMNIKFGLGPIVSQDFFRNDKHRLSYYGGFLFYLYNVNRISLSSNNTATDTRMFQGFNLNPQIGFLYQLVKLFPEGDFIINTNIEINTTYTLQNRTSPTYPQNWQSGSNDSIKYPTFIEYNLMLGYQVSF